MSVLTTLLFVGSSGALEPEFITRPVDGEVPRAASWCASVLADVTPSFGPKSPGVVLRQRIVGDQAIREYLERVASSARELDASYVAADAVYPPEVGHRWLAHAGRASLALTAVGALAFWDVQLFRAEHGVLALGVLGFAAWTVERLLPPTLKALFYDARNARLNRRLGRAAPGLVTAGRYGLRAGPEFAREVLAELARPAGERRSLDRSYVVALPLSLSRASLTPARRRPPTAGEIAAALKRSGERPLPADYRRLRIDHLYYHDELWGESVLLTFVREPRHPADWPWP